MGFWEVMMDVKFWIQLIQEFQNLGPLGPILLAASESLFSFLPFVAIVAFHVGVYGEILGFLYSWIGTTIGSAMVFLMIRFCSNHLIFLRKINWIENLCSWISKQDQLDLFLLTACAFMPSFLINLAYGFSDFDSHTFLKTILFSKSIMTAILVLFGSSIKNAMDHPFYFIIALMIFFCLYLISKQIKKKLQVIEKTN